MGCMPKKSCYTNYSYNAVAQENWDIKNVNVRLLLDGVEVRNEKIEPILKDWARRYYEQKVGSIEKQMKDSLEWIRTMQDKDELENEINKRVKLKLQKMIDSLDVWEYHLSIEQLVGEIK